MSEEEPLLLTSQVIRKDQPVEECPACHTFVQRFTHVCPYGTYDNSGKRLDWPPSRSRFFNRIRGFFGG